MAVVVAGVLLAIVMTVGVVGVANLGAGACGGAIVVLFVVPAAVVCCRCHRRC